MDISQYFEMRRGIEQISKSHSISVRELELLCLIGERGLLPSGKGVLELDSTQLDSGSVDSIAQAYLEICPELCLATISSSLIALHKKNLLRREINPKNQLKKYNELTKEGEELYQEVLERLK